MIGFDIQLKKGELYRQITETAEPAKYATSQVPRRR
jgi:hypothetical protein